MKKLSHTLVCLFIFFGCSNNQKECIDNQINPNGDSELAIVMRHLFDNSLEIKNLIIDTDTLISNKLPSELIQKFNDNLNSLHTAKPTDENLRDDGVYQAFAIAYINTSEKFTNNISHKNFNAMISKLKDQQSKLIQSERHEAWESIARKLAHEIKNPLTPIQLSAEQLRRKYLDKYNHDSELLDRATHTIIQQVEAMKGMVNDFSNY